MAKDEIEVKLPTVPKHEVGYVMLSDGRKVCVFCSEKGEVSVTLVYDDKKQDFARGVDRMNWSTFSQHLCPERLWVDPTYDAMLKQMGKKPTGAK